MSYLKKLFILPVFRDEIETQEAYLLQTIVWVFACVPIPFVFYTILLRHEDSVRTLMQTAFGESINLILLLMLRHKLVRPASIFQVSAFWLFFTITAITGGGVKSDAYLLGYWLVITLAGILLGKNGSFIFAFLSLAAGALMVYALPEEVFSPSLMETPLTTWMVSLVLFPAGAMLEYLASRTVRNALNRARASEKKYRLISQVSSDYTFATEIHKDGSATLSWVAGAFEQMTGYTFEEYVAGGSWIAHVHPMDLEQDAEDMQKLYQNQDIKSEIRTFAKNGEIRWEQIFAHPIWDEQENRLVGIFGAVRDITEQKKVEAALAYERDVLQIFMDNIPDQVYFKDSESRFVRINQAQAHFLRVGSPEDAIGKSDLDFQNPEIARALLMQEKQVMQTGQPAWNHIEFNPTEDGAPRWLSTTKVPAKNEFGQTIGIIGISRNITEQKMAEELEQNRRMMLENIIKLGKTLAEVNDINITLENIWHKIHDDLQFDRLAIFLYNDEQNSLERALGTDLEGKMDKTPGMSFPVDGRNTLSQIFSKPDGLYFTHNYDIENTITEDSDMFGVKDYASVAVWAGEKPVAVICTDQLLTQLPISDAQLEALRLLAGYAGLAIENARLNEKIQNELSQQIQAKEREEQRRATLEKVIKLGQHITEVHDLRTTLNRVWHDIHDDLEFDRVGIFLYDPDRNAMDGTFGTNNQGEMIDEWHLRFLLEKDNQDSKPFLQALKQPDTVFITHSYEDEYHVPAGHTMSGVRDHALIGTWSGERPIAIISVDHRITGRPITGEQLEALRLLAGYTGLAIENARLNSAVENELEVRKGFIVELESKNAELERFTYTVSHDLKSPLVTIRGFLGHLERDAKEGNYDKFRHDANRIETAVQKMQDLLRDLLDLSRIGRLINPPAEISFSEIVKDAMEIVQGQAEARKVLVHYVYSNIIIKCDRIRLTEALQNLIDNAIKFMGDQPHPKIEIGVYHNDQKENVFYVGDNGIGIAPEFHKKIFGLFDKLSSDTDGTGIGLALVKRIIEIHGGRIWVESQLGKGTTFYFVIP